MNNYTCNITFAKAHTNPKYMQVLKFLIDNPQGTERVDVLKNTHKSTFRSMRGWNAGPFTLLRENGYATFDRVGHKCYWKATAKGEGFYTVQLVKRDLKCA